MNMNTKRQVMPQKVRDEQNQTDENIIGSDDFDPDEDILTVEINGTRKSYLSYAKYIEITQKYRRLINQVTKTFQDQLIEKDETIEVLRNKLREFENAESDEIDANNEYCTENLSHIDTDEIDIDGKIESEQETMDSEPYEELSITIDSGTVEKIAISPINPIQENTCNICYKVLSTKRILMKHKKIVHAPIRAFTCSLCDKSFNARDSLNRHKLIHTGERPFKCADCGKTFNQSGNLNVHRKNCRIPKLLFKHTN